MLLVISLYFSIIIYRLIQYIKIMGKFHLELLLIGMNVIYSLLRLVFISLGDVPIGFFIFIYSHIYF